MFSSSEAILAKAALRLNREDADTLIRAFAQPDEHCFTTFAELLTILDSAGCRGFILLDITKRLEAMNTAGVPLWQKRIEVVCRDNLDDALRCVTTCAMQLHEYVHAHVHVHHVHVQLRFQKSYRLVVA